MHRHQEQQHNEDYVPPLDEHLGLECIAPPDLLRGFEMSGHTPGKETERRCAVSQDLGACGHKHVGELGQRPSKLRCFLRIYHRKPKVEQEISTNIRIEASKKEYGTIKDLFENDGDVVEPTDDGDVSTCPSDSSELNNPRKLLEEIYAALWGCDVEKMFDVMDYDNVNDVLDYVITGLCDDNILNCDSGERYVQGCTIDESSNSNRPEERKIGGGNKRKPLRQNNPQRRSSEEVVMSNENTIHVEGAFRCGPGFDPNQGYRGRSIWL